MKLAQRLIGTFGRRLGRKLSENQHELITQYLPTVEITSDNLEHKLSQYHTINLEIGCGNGEFFAKCVKEKKQELFLGCEPYINGMASLLQRVHGLDNFLVYADDVRLCLNLVPDHSLSNIFIICPDPWPKKKHHKRRLINLETLSILAPKLLKNGAIHMVTDHLDYAHWIYDICQKQQLLKFSTDDIEQCKIKEFESEWFLTKYQRKGLAQEHDIYYFKAVL